jgi:hypothetical protein
MTVIKYLFTLSILGYLIACNPGAKEAQQKKQDNFIDSLKVKTDRVTILFYLDFLRSKIEISDTLFTNKTNGLDTIIHFLGNIRNDSCSLNLSTIPDGDICFYKDTALIADMQFVLSGNCKGFYRDFRKNSEKYELTLSGDKVLSELKRKIFKKMKLPE